jgi:hypothetical protein
MKLTDSIFMVQTIKRYGTAMAFLAYPLLAGFAFAVHPNLWDFSVNKPVAQKIVEFHDNSVLHFGHFLMGIAVPALIIMALHYMKLLETKKPLTGLIGGSFAIAGAIILAMDKAALCFVPSAFDTVPGVEYAGLIPGINAMFQYKGFLAVLNFLPLLPIGFIILSIGLVRSNSIKRFYSLPVLIGSIVMCNPDIDLLGLSATVIMAFGFIPYALNIWKINDTNK